MGSAIPIYDCRQLNDRNQAFLDRLFDDGEGTGNKLSVSGKSKINSVH